MKKLLFIALPYHEYTKEIIRELKALDYEVTYYPIKLRSFFHRIVQTIFPQVFKSYLNKYHTKIILNEKGKNYDVILFIQVHYFSLENLQRLRSNHQNAIFVLYNWDSILTHDYRKHMQFFDKIASFDPYDAEKLEIDYLPLFCIKPFQNLARRKQKSQNIYFVGNIARSERYKAIKAFKQYCQNEGLTFEAYLKCSPVKYIKLLIEGYIPLDISFTNISKKKLISMIQNSTTVFDFANHQQTGYTMRFIENLCAGKKIITNNSNVLKESFYSEGRILYIEDLKFDKVKYFNNLELKMSDDSFSEFYLENFLRTLLK